MGITQSGAAVQLSAVSAAESRPPAHGDPLECERSVNLVQVYAVPRSYLPSIDGSRRTERLLSGTRCGVCWQV